MFDMDKLADSEGHAIPGLLDALNVAIVWLKSQPRYTALLSKSFGVGQTCPPLTALPTAPIGPESMGGLVIICGGLAVGAFLVAGLECLQAPSPEPREEREILDRTETQGEMLQALLEGNHELCADLVLNQEVRLEQRAALDMQVMARTPKRLRD